MRNGRMKKTDKICPDLVNHSFLWYISILCIFVKTRPLFFWCRSKGTLRVLLCRKFSRNFSSMFPASSPDVFCTFFTLILMLASWRTDRRRDAQKLVRNHAVIFFYHRLLRGRLEFIPLFRRVVCPVNYLVTVI